VCFGVGRLSADDHVCEPVGDSLVWARRGAIGRIGGPDQPKADDLRKLTDRLEQRPARWTQIADLIAASCPIQAVAARLAFEMGHRRPFRSVSFEKQMTIKSRIFSLAWMSRESPPTWSFLTNHAQVMLCIAEDPGIRLRELGETIGITERAAHRIVSDLAAAGYLARERQGRRTRYTIDADLPVPDPLARAPKIGELLKLLNGR
jgi:hypothetical protein